jgi:hypothetical protein
MRGKYYFQPVEKRGIDPDDKNLQILAYVFEIDLGESRNDRVCGREADVGVHGPGEIEAIGMKVWIL